MVYLEKLTTALLTLLRVKTLVTVSVIGVFTYLSVNGAISADNVMIVVTNVVAFYFGTQHEEKERLYESH